jgi:hypothetical protein
VQERAGPHFDREIVGSHVADHELEQFENMFSKNDLPDDTEEIIVPDSCETIFEALFSSGKFASKKELHRLVDQGVSNWMERNWLRPGKNLTGAKSGL